MSIAKDAGLPSELSAAPVATSTGRQPLLRAMQRCPEAKATEASNQSWQHLLRSLNAKGGERKRLTILFADIRNSTGLIDSLGDPELGMRRLQPVLDLMNEAVVVTTASSTNRRATGSWRYSARRSLMRITPSAAASRRWRCRTG